MATTATRTEITADTDLLMLTADFAGYTLEDALLGTMSADEYARLANQDDDGGASAIAGMCELLDNYRNDGSVWLASEYADAQAAEQENRTCTIEQFTPRQAHEAIMAQAAREERFAA